MKKKITMVTFAKKTAMLIRPNIHPCEPSGIPDGSHGWIFGLINMAVFFAKVTIVIFFFMWIRWTLPRFRYDQLMRLGWLFFFEIALVNIFVVAAILPYYPA